MNKEVKENTHIPWLHQVVSVSLCVSVCVSVSAPEEAPKRQKEMITKKKKIKNKRIKMIIIKAGTVGDSGATQSGPSDRRQWPQFPQEFPPLTGNSNK